MGVQLVVTSPEAEESEMRYAPAGYKFAIPLTDILNAKGGYLQAKDGSKEADWEPQVRIGRKGSGSDGLFPVL